VDDALREFSLNLPTSTPVAITPQTYQVHCFRVGSTSIYATSAAGIAGTAAAEANPLNNARVSLPAGIAVEVVPVASVDVDAASDRLYISSPDKIQSLRRDGSGLVTVFQRNGSSPEDIQADVRGGSIYWSDGGGLRRTNLDGSGEEELFAAASGLSNFVPTAADFASGTLFGPLLLDGLRGVGKMNVDGSAAVLMLGPPSYYISPVDVAVDRVGGKAYWMDRSSSLGRSNLDGTGFENVLTGSMWGGLAVDPKHGKLYWSESTEAGAFIRRANLDGSAVEDLVQSYADDIALDLSHGRMYWTRLGSLYSSDLDGLSAPVRLVGPSSIRNVAYVPPDDDWDGVEDGLDLCSGTPAGYPVEAFGCADFQVDPDGDGICSPAAASGEPGACNGSDNCPNVPNPGQEDTDGDGIADACESQPPIAVGGLLGLLDSAGTQPRSPGGETDSIPVLAVAAAGMAAVAVLSAIRLLRLRR
jgi:hypothetical protein